MQKPDVMASPFHAGKHNKLRMSGGAACQNMLRHGVKMIFHSWFFVNKTNPTSVSSHRENTPFV